MILMVKGIRSNRAEKAPHQTEGRVQSVSTVEKRGICSIPAQLGIAEQIGIEDERNWEYLEGLQDANIKFSLKRHLQFWKDNLDPSSFVLNVLSHGYILPLTGTPPPMYAKNNRSSLRSRKFVKGAIGELIRGGLVTESPLLQPANSIRKREVAVGHRFAPREWLRKK